MRIAKTVVYCAIDDLIGPTGKALSGFPEFLEALNEAGCPCVWVTSRSRIQLDTCIRRFQQSDPFIAEGGSGAYIPEDYFHLRPEKTIRFARFTCIPAAKPLPAAKEALDDLSEATGVEVVALRTLSPRELTQNSGLPAREAESLRQRDFDEYFFFAGASEPDVQRFLEEAARRKLQVRPRGHLWSLAIGASLPQCVRELSKLYDRALRSHAFTVAISTSADAASLASACDRAILLTDREAPTPSRNAKSIPLFAPDTWERLLEAVTSRS